MGPLDTDPRVELVRRVLDTVPAWPSQTQLDAAVHEILASLDNEHAHDGRTCITFDDETDPE